MRLSPVRSLRVDSLQVQVYEDRCQMGAAAALEVADHMLTLLSAQPRVCMVFAAAPSQDEFLAVLSSVEGLPWDRVVALHMDEYVGLAESTPQAFRNYLKEHLLDRVRPGTVHLIRGEATSAAAECRRYARLLRRHPVDIVCAGIGENGHLAFNEPGLADFSDRALARVVELDDRSRAQQVHDGCFARLDLVPRQAITLTIPALMSAKTIYCVVPGARKAEAVKRTLTGPVDAACPASVLRLHPRAVLFLDRDSAALVDL